MSNALGVVCFIAHHTHFLNTALGMVLCVELRIPACAGAGSSGLGVCEQIVRGMMAAGLSKSQCCEPICVNMDRFRENLDRFCVNMDRFCENMDRFRENIDRFRVNMDRFRVNMDRFRENTGRFQQWLSHPQVPAQRTVTCAAVLTLPSVFR